MGGGEPARGDRAGGHQHALAQPAAEHIEGNQTRPIVALDLEERASGDLVESAGGPNRPGHSRLDHLSSLSITTCSERAWSRASGVSTARRARTSRAPVAAASRTRRSVTAPFSMRIAGAALGTLAPPAR